MKRLFALLLCLVCVSGCGCGSRQAAEPESGRLAVIKYLPKEDVSQLIVLDKWQ